jgi:hypothetical protein
MAHGERHFVLVTPADSSTISGIRGRLSLQATSCCRTPGLAKDTFAGFRIEKLLLVRGRTAS